jgi:hypothetical protein
MQIINSGAQELIIIIEIVSKFKVDVINPTQLKKDYIYTKEINSNIIFNSLINMITD